MDTLYDVILFGVQENRDIEEVAQTIAQKFSITQSKAEQLLSNQPVVIKRSVPREAATRIEQVLTRAGARANCKPSTSSESPLELVPMEKPKLVCPECGFKIELEGKEPPSQCPQCGLVFAKYEKVQERQKEAAIIRERLERAQAMREEEARRQQLAREEEERRKALEAQIRKELGLPAVVDTKAKLWSSAAATLLLGVGLGASIHAILSTESGRLGLDTSTAQFEEQSPEQLRNALAQVSKQLVAAGFDPQHLLGAATGRSSARLDDLSAEIIDEISAPPGKAGASAPGMGGVTAAGAAETPHGAAQDQTGEYALQSGRELESADFEWDLFIRSGIDSALRANDPAKARRLADRLPDNPDRYIAIMRIAAYYAERGQAAQADALIDAILQSIDTKASGMSRVAMLTAIVPVLAEAKMESKVTGAIEAAERSINGLHSSERPSAWALLAAAQAKLGRENDARNSIEQARAAAKELEATESRILIASQLAEVFYHLGARGDASRILEKALVAAQQINRPLARDRAIAGVAVGLARVGEVERALEANGMQASLTRQDEVLYALLERQAASGRPFGLVSIADAIASPSVRARAFGLVGVSSHDPKLAKEYLQRGIATSEEIASASERVMIQGEIARFLARTPDKGASERLFDGVSAQLQSLEPGPDRDYGWARLATNRARALDQGNAEQALRMIEDAKIAETTRTDLAQVKDVVAIMTTALP